MWIEVIGVLLVFCPQIQILNNGKRKISKVNLVSLQLFFFQMTSGKQSKCNNVQYLSIKNSYETIMG